MVVDTVDEAVDLVPPQADPGAVAVFGGVVPKARIRSGSGGGSGGGGRHRVVNVFAVCLWLTSPGTGDDVGRLLFWC